MNTPELTQAEMRALRWLLTGAGQKFITPKPRPGPFFEDHENLVETHRALESKGLVRVGHPDYFGSRSVNLTPEGRGRVSPRDPNRQEKRRT